MVLCQVHGLPALIMPSVWPTLTISASQLCSFLKVSLGKRNYKVEREALLGPRQRVRSLRPWLCRAVLLGKEQKENRTEAKRDTQEPYGHSQARLRDR